ncbi:P-loop NTPase fold protein [uncultured Pleomorphomonas sp.]|nr:P-loop NTPase fold protein [uncultured Pleomorphomonas sp.]
MRQDRSQTVTGDRALEQSGGDRLGFREVAKRIAVSLVDRATTNGLVVGVEGAWGAGKSSLLFLIGEELRELPDDKRPTVISFRPWLIANRDTLITSLFDELSKQLESIAAGSNSASHMTAKKAQKAATALRRFVAGLSKAGAVIEIAGDWSGFALIRWFEKILAALPTWVHRSPLPPQLTELKEKLIQALRDLDHRFVITIDDVDRLEPEETKEILRLVRSVADLPNVIYLLCYDNKILADSIIKSVGVENGCSYLEKIVQLTVMVPKPESLQLRQWFSDELGSIASPKDDEELSRLKLVIDYEGGQQLRTPRSVVRALDAIRFFWPPLRELGADLADLVWLQLIKEGNLDLYRWVENYCATSSVVQLGIARVEDAEKEKMNSDLLAIMKGGRFSDRTYRHYFANQLPGAEVDYSEEDKGLKLFEHIGDYERDESIRKRRLSSPDHYRLYFALEGPSYVLSQSDFSKMREAVSTGPEQTGRELQRLHEQHTAGSLSKADLMLERIELNSAQTLTPIQSRHLLIALSNELDEAFRRKPFDRSWTTSLWDRAQRLVPPLLSRLEPLSRAATITAIFHDGRAIGWLTSLLRHETFAHGRYGGRRSPESEWLFSDDELTQVSDILHDRYLAMSVSDLLDCPNPGSILFAWQQLGDEHGPRQLVTVASSSDVGLVEILEKLTSLVISSDRGIYDVIKPENIAPFMDYGIARERVKGI